MKKSIRLMIPPILAGLLLLTGCSGLMPPNIPRTGGTSTPLAAASAYPAATTAPNGAATGYPAATVVAAPTTAPASATNTTAPAAPTDTQAPPQPAPTNTTAPVATAAPPSPSVPLATATTGPALSSVPLPGQRTTIQFPANATSFVVTANLAQGASQAYQLQASAGQRLYVTTDGNAVLQVYNPSQQPLTGVLSAINPVAVPLPQTGMYAIALQGSGPVVMSVYIPAVGANQNVAAPLPAPLTPIQFQPGATSASFTVNTSAGTPLGYTLNVQAGQRMTVTTSGNATLTLLAPDRATLVPSAVMPTHQWLFTLNQSGSYNLIVLGSGPVTLNVSIPALSGNVPPTPVPLPGSPTRVTFGAGNASATINTTLAAGTPKAYVLTVSQGQTLFVSTTGSVDVTIYGPGSTVLVSGHAAFPNRWSVPATQTGDYTFVVSGSGPETLVFFVPPR